MADIDDVVVINHQGKEYHAVPYLPDGNIVKFLITLPNARDVLHTVEGLWFSREEAREAVTVKVIALINLGKI